MHSIYIDVKCNQSLSNYEYDQYMVSRGLLPHELYLIPFIRQPCQIHSRLTSSVFYLHVILALC